MALPFQVAKVWKVQQEKPLGSSSSGSGFCLANVLPISQCPPVEGRQTTWAALGGVPDAAAGRELSGLFVSHCHRLVNPEVGAATATQPGNCGLIGNDCSRCTITRGHKTNKQQQAACAAEGFSKGQKTKVAPSLQRSAQDPISSASPTFHYYDTPTLITKPRNLRLSRTPSASRADKVPARRHFEAPGVGKVTEVSRVLGPSTALRPRRGADLPRLAGSRTARRTPARGRGSRANLTRLTPRLHRSLWLRVPDSAAGTAPRPPSQGRICAGTVRPHHAPTDPELAAVHALGRSVTLRLGTTTARPPV